MKFQETQIYHNYQQLPSLNLMFLITLQFCKGESLSSFAHVCFRHKKSEHEYITIHTTYKLSTPESDPLDFKATWTSKVLAYNLLQERHYIPWCMKYSPLPSQCSFLAQSSSCFKWKVFYLTVTKSDLTWW